MVQNMSSNLISKITQSILLILLFSFGPVLFAQAELISFTNLGANDSCSAGYKSTSDNRFCVGNAIDIGGTDLYIDDVEPQTFKVKADGSNLTDFSLSELTINSFSSDFTLKGTGDNTGTYLRFYNDGDIEISTTYLVSNKLVTTVEVSMAELFGSFSTITSVARFELKIALNNPGGAIGNFQIRNFQVDVSANTAPVNTLPSPPAISEDEASFVIANDINIADADNDNQTVTLTITGGTVSIGTTNLSFTTGDGTDDSTMVFSGTLVDINSALDAMTFTPTPNLNGTNAGAIQIATNDGNGGSDDDTLQFDIIAENDEPVNTLPSIPTINEDDVNVALSDSINIADVEGDNQTVTLTITGGTASISTSNLSFTTGDGLDDNTMVFSGALADINTALDAMTFTPTANLNGINAGSLQIAINDGNGGSDDDTLQFDIVSVNDAPTDIALTATSINQSVTNVGGDVAVISSTDVEDVSFSYTLQTTGTTCNSTNGAHNSSFQINGSIFETSTSLLPGSYSVCLQTDDTSDSFQEAFTITVIDNVGPSISAVSIPNSSHKVTDTVTTTINVSSDSDDYTAGSGTITGSIDGYTLSNITKTNDTTYTAVFTITDGGTDVSDDDDIVVNFTLRDSIGNVSSTYTTAISQSSDAIYANLPTINLTTDTNTINEDSGVATLTATLTDSLNNQWPEDVTVNLTYSGTATAGTDYNKSDNIIISAASTSNSNAVTGVADSLFDAAADETVIVDIATVSVGNEGITNQQTITISDAQSTPTLTLSVSSNNIPENGGTSTITATLNTATYADVIVNLDYSGTAVSGGTDYNNPSASITIPAGSLATNALSGIAAVDDVSADGAKTVVVDIASVNGGSASENGTQQQTVTISDDDDGTPPVFASPPSLSSITAVGASLSVDMDEDGSVYYIVVDNSATKPTAAQVKSGASYSAVTAHSSGSISTTATVGSTTISGLSDGISYDVYIVGEDSVANLQSDSDIVKLALDTLDVFANVSSISLSGSPVETATALNFSVVFTDDVINVSTDDFTPLLTSGDSNVAATIASISGAGSAYTVTVNSGVTVGELRLDLTANTDIIDESSNTPDAYSTGSVHTTNTNHIATISEATSNVGPFTIDEDIKTPLDLSDVFIADGNDDLLTVTLSVDKGLLFSIDGNTTVDDITIMSTDSDGSSSILLMGRSADLNVFLDDTSRISFQTDENDTTSSAFTITPDDSLETSSGITEMITINPINDAPLISGTPTTSIVDGNAYSFTPTASDIDGDTPLTFSITNKPDWATFDSATGALTGNPQSGDIGSTTDIVIRVEDPSLEGDDLNAFDLTIVSSNSAPVISGSPATTILEDSHYSFVPTVNDTDSGDTKIFSIINKPSWAAFNTATGELSGTPSNSNLGTTQNISITVTDSIGAQDSLNTFSLSVSNVNDAPVISGTPTTTIAEDVVYSFTPTVTDIDSGDSQTFTITNKPSWATFNTTRGTLSGTPSNDDVGSTAGIVITVNDSNNTHASLASFELTVTNVNDAPIAMNDILSIPASSDDLYILNVLINDSDVDGDLLTVDVADADIGSVSIAENKLVYQADDYFIGTVNVTYSINDGNGASDSAQLTLTIEHSVQSKAPLITVPDDISVNATGLFTKIISDTATAINQSGASIAVSLVDDNLLLPPGVHNLVWQATNTQGIRSEASQQVIVHPLISMSKDQVVHEGNEVEVRVLLNGSAPQYPITLPYSISGTADNGDHDAVDGEVTITEGQIGYIRFTTSPDSEIETDESVIITLGNTLNLGSKSSTQVIISENNIAPAINFRIEQNEQPRQTMSKEDGDVTITAILTDPNPDDTVMVSWESDTLINSDNNQFIFSFSPQDYPVGHHALTVVATDNGEPSLSVTKHIFINIKDMLMPLNESQDSDGDGIPDSTEGYADDDGDGIPNYQDSNQLETCNVVPETLETQTQYLVEGEPGICLRKGSTSLNSELGGLQIGESELATIDSEAENVGGLFDYIAYGLPQAGQVYSIVFPQLVPIPSGAVYRKYSNNEWKEYVVDADNKLLSSAGEQGYCPPPGDSSWVMGLQENHWCVQLQIQDGGPNDDDGIANGTIIDPGGVSVLRTINNSPVAEDDSVSLMLNNSITISVLDNDSDIDGDVLTVVNASANFGSVVIDDQQSITYTANTDYIGLDTVTYTIADNNGRTAVAQVHITVKANNTSTVTNTSGGGSMSWLFSIGVLLLAFRRRYGSRLLVLLLTMLSFNSHASDDVVMSKEVTNAEQIENSDHIDSASNTHHWSISVNTGISRLHGSSNVTGIPADEVVDIDDNSVSWGLALNYNITSKWAISLGYLDLGESKTELHNNTPNYHQTVAQVTPIFANGIVLGFNYKFWQHDNFSSEVMAGAFAWKSQIDSSVKDVTIEHKQDGIDLYAGLGFTYALSNEWEVGLAMKRYFIDANDIDDFSLKLAYHF